MQKARRIYMILSMEPAQEFTIRRKPVATQSVVSPDSYSEASQHDPRDEHLQQNGTLPRSAGWTPLWLRRRVLLVFFLLYAILLVALEIVDVYSTKQDGIVSPEPNKYYLWTYGPTAVLTLILTFWNLADYRMRQMMPWVALASSKYLSASQTVLLDYISPTRPEILWHSIANRHWLVITSSLVSVLQTVMIILSTGLFTISQMPTTIHNVSFRTDTKLVNRTSFGAGVSVDSLSVNIYDAVKVLQLPYPIGTTERFVYQTFSPIGSTLSSNVLQQATVDVVSIDMECKDAEVHVSQWAYSWQFTPCGSPGNAAPTLEPYGPQTINVVSGKSNTSVYFNVSLGKDKDVTNFAYSKSLYYRPTALPPFGTGDDDAMIYVIGQAQQSGDVGPRPSNCTFGKANPWANIKILRSKSWVCAPKFELRKAIVKFNSTALQLGASPEIQILSDPPPTPYIRIWNSNYDNVLEGILNSINFRQDQESLIPIKGEGIAPIKPLQMVQNAGIEELLSTDLYLNLSKTYFVGLWAQILRLETAVLDNKTMHGDVTQLEDRLIIQKVPLRTLQSILGTILILLCAMIMLLPRSPVVSHDPATIHGLASILSDNIPFTQSFKAYGSCDNSALHRLCGQSNFRSCMRSIPSQPNRATLALEKTVVSTESSSIFSQSDPVARVIPSWEPFISRKLAKFLMLLTVIAVIITLQVLLAVSKRHSGLVDLSMKRNEHLAWSIIPAGLMAGIAIYFQALQSTYKQLIPFYNLRRGAKALSSIDTNFQSMPDLEVLIRSLRDRQSGVFFMTISAMVAAFLTIIVSGVFTASPIASRQTVPVVRKSWFRDDGSGDNGKLQNNALVAGLILEANLSHPTWTYQDLVLPSLQFQKPSSKESEISVAESSKIQVTIPAVRSKLNCTLYDQKDIPNLTYSQTPPIYFRTSPTYMSRISADVPGPPECAASLPIQIGSVSQAGGYFPFYFSSVLNNTRGGLQKNASSTCPSLYYFWGYQGSTVTSTNKMYGNVTYAMGLACYETIETVDVNTTFYGSSFTIRSDEPPLVDQNSSRTFSAAVVEIPYANLPERSNYSSTTPFWSTIMYKYGFNGSDLGDPSRTGDILAAIKEVHGTVRAQQYHAALRYDQSDASTTLSSRAEDNSTYDAVVINSQRNRLIQHEISTHVLTALLLIMVICTLLASWFISIKYVLPKNPSSIAAMISLLADSNILQGAYQPSANPPPGSTDRYPRSATFKLGWFGNESDGQRVFTINRIDEKIGGTDEKGTTSSRNVWEMLHLKNRGQRTVKRNTFTEVSQIER